jgi:hypothetical protein
MHKEKRTLTHLIVGLVLLTLAIPVVLKEARAQPAPTFSAINPGPGSWTASSWTAETPNPAEIGTTNFTFHSPQTSVGNTFFVNITVSNVQSMKSWGIGVIFDNTTLAYNGSRRPPDHVFSPLESPDFPTGSVSMVAPAVVITDYDATHQEIQWGCAYIMPDPPWTFNGTGVMCQLRFKVIAAVNATFPKWSTLLDFDPEWTAVYMHPTGTPALDFASGKVSYIYPIVPGATTLAVSPASVVNPSLTVGNSFTVNLTVTNATDLYQWQAEVYYNNTLLNATGTTEGDFLPTRGTTVFQTNILQNFNATHGKIALTDGLSGAASGVYGNGQLAAMTFQLLANGSTPISISNDILYDSENNPTSHTIQNGYFSNIPQAVTVDVAVTDIQMDKAVACAGWPLQINVTVANKGDNAETFDVKVYYDTNLVDTQTVTALDPNSEKTVPFVWNTTSVPPNYGHNYTISAEIPPLLNEVNVANNKLTDGTVMIKLMGDINGDGTVNIPDIVLALNYFGSYPGHPRWNPDADLDLDNKITIADIIIVLANLGKTQ